MTVVSLARTDGVLRGTARGKGPTILLLHAGGESRGVWAPVAEVLADAGFRSVAFDQRGHGDSDGAATRLVDFVDDVVAMSSAEAAVVLVGASLGGFAALGALADPVVADRVRGLVLVDVVPDPPPAPVRRFLAARGLLRSRQPLVEDILSRADDLRRITAQLPTPILLVRGETSHLTDDDAARLLALAPESRVVPVPGAGHLVARDAPRALGDLIASAAAEWTSVAE